MKRRSKRRLAPTTRVGGVAGKRKRFRGGVGIGIPFGKTFGPEVKILPGTTAAKTAKNRAHYAGYFSLSLYDEQSRARCEGERREQAARPSGSTVRAYEEDATRLRPQAHKAQDSCNNNKRNAKSEGGDFTLAGLHSRPRT